MQSVTFTSKADVFASLLVAGEKTEPQYAIRNKFLAHGICSLCSGVHSDALWLLEVEKLPEMIDQATVKDDSDLDSLPVSR